MVLANGDHVYWDQESGRRRRAGSPAALETEVGEFSPEPGDPHNDAVLATVGERQIVGLYGVSLRSTPVWFIRDDHDYFENDEFYGDHATFPPSALNRALAQRLHEMFWPEFLPDRRRPPSLPGRDCSYGTLRWGRLVEALLYDCRGHMSADPRSAWFLPPSVEAWVASRTRDASVRHIMQVPSTPWGWTAGKWGEWYPDVLDAQGRMAASGKPGWPDGWFAQHQRLLALAGSRGRDSLSLSGDLHAVGTARIARSRELVPQSGVYSVLTGPLGTDDLAFPSAFRRTPPLIPAGVELDRKLNPIEKNGFTLIDVSEPALRVRQFAWRPPEPAAAIAGLQPLLDVTIPTGG